MSITDLTYNSETKALEIVIKFFTDDIEKALEEKTQERLLIGTDKEASITNDLLKAYLKEHFSIQQEKQSLALVYLGKESERDYTYAYLELENFNPSYKIWLQNTLLIHLFEDQANKVNYKAPAYSKSVTLHKDLKGAQF